MTLFIYYKFCMPSVQSGHMIQYPTIQMQDPVSFDLLVSLLCQSL